MSEIAQRLATEHRSYGVSCECGHHPDENEGIPSARTRHLIAVTERAIRADVSEQIAQAWDEGHAAGRDYQGDGWNSDAHDPGEDNPYRSTQ